MNYLIKTKDYIHPDLLKSILEKEMIEVEEVSDEINDLIKKIEEIEKEIF